jgi:hypothetical protein
MVGLPEARWGEDKDKKDEEEESKSHLRTNSQQYSKRSTLSDFIT